jgi:hypothetical protein
VRDHYVAICRARGRTLGAASLVAAFTTVELAAALTGGTMSGLDGVCEFWLAAMVVEAMALAPAVLRSAYGPSSPRRLRAESTLAGTQAIKEVAA